MENKTPKFRKYLLFILLLILSFPFIQSSLNFIKVKPLNGAVVLAVQDTFSVKKWFSGEFQEKQEKYINDNFGLRNIFVRLNNQIAFSIFKLAKANGVIVGKNNFLYEEPYIQAYLGNDFIGTDSIVHVVNKLKFIQDTLEKLNRTLFVIYAPSKASYYPENIPDKYNKTNNTTNYENFISQSNLNNINFIDFNKYFIENKNKTKYPLFPKYGIHWTNYGGCLVIDSVIKYIEKKRNINMRHIYWNEIVEKDPFYADVDIADGMNLLFKFKDEKLGYPTVLYQKDSNVQRPSTLVIADSFYWILYNNGISNTFKNDHFWYYNKTIYPEDSYMPPYNTDMINLKDEISKNDVIIIVATTPSLPKIGWEFIQSVYSLFKFDDSKNQLKEMIAKIYKNKEWFDQIKAKAIERNMPLDTMIYYDAQWTINELNKKK